MKMILIIALLFIQFNIFAPLPVLFPDYEKLATTINKIELGLFLDALGDMESGDTINHPDCWTTVNSIGAAGRWQQTDIALKDIHYKGSRKHFLHSKVTQKNCVIKLLKRNKQLIKYYKLDKFIGKNVRGVTISWSGALAACHLGGIDKFKQFIETGHNARSGDRSVRMYLKEFEGYNLKL